MTRRTFSGILAVGGALAAVSHAPAAGQGPPGDQVAGTVVSIRGDIFALRPSLRPVMTRVSVSDQTQVLTYADATLQDLKPGMRVVFGARYQPGGALRARWLAAALTPVGELSAKFTDLRINKNWGFAFGGGNLRSVTPCVVVDDAGHTHRVTLTPQTSLSLLKPMDRRGLLIGTSVEVDGPRSPDGVILAKTVTLDQQQAKMGTMFGAIVSADGGTLQVRPRYSQDVLPVTLAPGCTVQRQITIDPDSVKVGDPVTVWGQPEKAQPARPNAPKPAGNAGLTLDGMAVLLGDQRYPAADTSQGQMLLSGRFTSLDPVTLLAADGRQARVVVPAQMPVVRLESAALSDLKPGANAMLLLTRGSDGSFQATAVVLDASPWVGYGG